QCGELPMELIKELKTAGIDLLPRNWSRLERRCSCPDYGDPCKHMAAVYYTLAREIDQNPFGIFLLRGLDLKAAFSLEEPESLPPPVVLVSRKEGDASSETEADIILRDNFTSFIISLLRPAPAFTGGDFKMILAEFYHHSARRYEAILTAGAVRGEGGRHLAETEFSLIPDTVPEEAEGEMAWPSLSFSHPVSGSMKRTLLEAAPVFLAAEEGEGTASYRYFFRLYRLFFLILRAGAFIPVVDHRGSTLQILWKPLNSVADVDQAIAQTASLCPPLLRMEEANRKKPGSWADRKSTTLYLLTALCTQYVRACGFLDRHPKYLDSVGELFFTGKTLKTTTVAYQSTPRAIASWLAVLEQRAGKYRYRFEVAETATSGKRRGTQSAYRLSVELAPAESSHSVSIVWTKLHKARGLEYAVDALSFATLLSSYLPELGELQKVPSVVLEEERLLFFLREAAPILQRLGAEVRVPKELGRELKPRLTVAARVKGGGNLQTGIGLEDLLDYNWKIALGNELFDLKEFEDLVQNGRKVVRLKDGFLTLDPEEIRRLLEGTRRSPGPADAIAAYLEGATAFDAQARTAFDNLFREKEISLPRGLRAELRSYQVNGFCWAWNNLMNGFGCLLADDMGLGKTVQAIALIQKLKEEDRLNEGALVVVPASLMTNWRRELQRFAPELRVHDYYGPKRAVVPDQDVYLSTYETVLRDVEKLSDCRFSLLLLDEAHILKNAATKRAKSVRVIPSTGRLALSGTPVENRLEDLRAIMDLVFPGYLGDPASFRTAWRIPIELHRDEERAAALRRVTAPFLLRRLKTDPSIISDLPEKIVIDEYARLTPAQGALYESVLTELAGTGASGLENPEARSALILKLLTALKQVCNHPRAYDRESPADPSLSGKAKLLLDLLSSILEGGEKVIVFTQYVETLQLLKEFITAELGEPCLILHGGLSPSARRDAVDRFQNEGSFRIFLISLKAGGVGLNLTAASRVIHYDLWFNPAVENQATDRAFRIGQTRRVFVHRLITADTFEEKIDAMIKAKAELADLSVPRGESWLTDLEPEDLRRLFQRG
ncbi:MAG TPA: DEAD/DEAH box helicase, partial [Spirochaetales bacterium]|nr:DEAD/DEAH box helicase [Spirochaetales bacterium]